MFLEFKRIVLISLTVYTLLDTCILFPLSVLREYHKLLANTFCVVSKILRADSNTFRLLLQKTDIKLINNC